jgi:hypothetical protein
MKSTLRAVALFALICILVAGLAVRTKPISAAEATTGLITGTVTSASGAPIPNASVTAASPSGRYSAVTDSHGRFVMLGIEPDTYIVTVDAAGFETATQSEVRVLTGQQQRTAFRLETTIRTIGNVRARNQAFTVGAPSDSFTVSGDAARAQFPTATSSGLSSYTQGSVQGAIANDVASV